MTHQREPLYSCEFNEYLYSSAADRKGDLWFLTSKGLYCIHDGIIKLQLDRRFFIDKFPCSLAIDPADDLFIASCQGRVFRLQDGGLSLVAALPSLPPPTTNDDTEEVLSSLPGSLSGSLSEILGGPDICLFQLPDLKVMLLELHTREFVKATIVDEDPVDDLDKLFSLHQ